MNSYIKKSILIIICILFPIFVFIGFIFYANSSYYSSKEILYFVKANNYNILFNFFKKEQTDSRTITLKIKSFNKVKRLRDSCLDKTATLNSDFVQKRKFKSEIIINNHNYKSKLSLTGKNHDHISKSNWSFKIKSKKEIFGLKKFKLLLPTTRASKHPINEFIGHKILENEGMLNLKYFFINVNLNNNNYIYAVEEAYSDGFFERNNIKSGLIISSLNNIKRRYKISKKDEKEILDKIKLFQLDSLKVNDIFDVKMTATHYAIADLIDGHHCHWSGNSHYLYNNETKKLMPISREWDSPYSPKSTLTEGKLFFKDYKIREKFHTPFMKDSIFIENYKNELARISSFEYLKVFYEKFDSDIKKEYNILNNRYYLIQGDIHYLYDRGEKMKALLNQ